MAGLVGWWRFDEGSGMTAYDHSKKGNNGSLENMEEEDWVDGKVGKCLDLDGDNDWIKLPTNAFSTGPVSMAFWIKTTETRERIPLTIEGAWFFKVGRGGSDNKIGVSFTGSSVDIIDSTSVINDDEWHFVVATHDGTTARLYIDGSEENSATQSPYNIDGLSRVSAIGGQYNGSFNINALLDEVRIYNCALMEEEVEALFIWRPYTHSVSEGIGVKEKTLRSSREHSGGEDITTLILSNIWETTSSVSTTWEESKSLQKDE